jgi:hypothetical protein
MKRIQWVETLTCTGCRKIEQVTLSGPMDPDAYPGEKNRIDEGPYGFKAEAVGPGFQFRCVVCNRNARVTKAD